MAKRSCAPPFGIPRKTRKAAGQIKMDVGKLKSLKKTGKPSCFFLLFLSQTVMKQMDGGFLLRVAIRIKMSSPNQTGGGETKKKKKQIEK